MEFTKDIQLNQKPTVNQYVTLTYHGFLSGSSELTIVYGFGESWEHTSEMEMQKTSDGFTAKIKMLDFGTFNFCFRNSNYEWDNNSNCNYISSILPAVNKEAIHAEIELLFNELCSSQEEQKNVQTFDIDALIEEILQPIAIQDEVEENTPIQITSQPIDLGVEIANVLSQIEKETPIEPLAEYSTLDEILSGTVIGQTPVDLFEEDSVDEIVNELIQNMSTSQEKTNEVQTTKTEETALINPEDAFIISPRKLSKFYLFRKRLKLAFYKALVKIPKMIFGTEEE